MKSPGKQHSNNKEQKYHQKSYNYAQQIPSKKAPLFEQQSPSYRSKSIDQKVTQLNDKLIFISIQQRDYRKAISQLHQLENYIHVPISLNQNQDNQTSKTNKLLYYYELSICYYNHAVVYQKYIIPQKRVNNDQETAKYFQKSLKNLEYMQGYITSREEGVSYSIEVAKLQIQYCSILSQTGKHQQAITYGEKALLKLIECFRILEAVCFQFVMENRLPETNSNSRDINFKKYVVFEAQKILKELSSLPQPHQLPSQFKKKYDSLMQKTFFWKDNSQNNQKLLRKQLQIQRKQVNSDRNILGVQKNSYLNDNLTLEALTNLQAKSIKYSFNNDPFFLLSTPKLTEMAFFVAMIYFMIATEIRFSQVDLNVNKLKIDEKYKKLSRDQRMIKCKMIHMKAIEIAGKFLPEKNDFFTHILNRFNKNYKCIMEEINEQSKEQSMKQLSGQNQKQNPSQKQILPEEQYGIQNSLNMNKSHQKSKHQSQYSIRSKAQMTIRDSQSPSLASLKRVKKVKLVDKENTEDQNPKLKRKLSSSKQKQNNYNFKKHQRSISHQQTHKRTLSYQITQGSSASIRMISSFNGGNHDQTQKRQRTRTVTLSARKGDEKLFKKKSYQEQVFGRVNFANVQNMGVQSSDKAKMNEVDVAREKSKANKVKLKGLNSPMSKRKLSSNKLKLRSQETGDYGESSKAKGRKFTFQRKLHF